MWVCHKLILWNKQQSSRFVSYDLSHDSVESTIQPDFILSDDTCIDNKISIHLCCFISVSLISLFLMIVTLKFRLLEPTLLTVKISLWQTHKISLWQTHVFIKKYILRNLISFLWKYAHYSSRALEPMYFRCNRALDFLL